MSIVGSDELGLIHGIYDFSESYSGIGSYAVGNAKGSSASSIGQHPAGDNGFSTKNGPPTWFFFNDEDLLVGFQMEHVEDGFCQKFGSIYLKTPCD